MCETNETQQKETIPNKKIDKEKQQEEKPLMATAD
jgi:hypothetical protein